MKDSFALHVLTKKPKSPHSQLHWRSVFNNLPKIALILVDNYRHSFLLSSAHTQNSCTLCMPHYTQGRFFLRGQGEQLCHYLSLLQGYHNNQQVPFKSQSQRQRVMTVEPFCYCFTFFPTQKPKHRLVKTHSGRMFTFIINPTHCAQWSNYKICLRMRNCSELIFSKQFDPSYCWV